MGYYKDEHRYDDIIGLKHPISRTHPQMSIHDRAAQFNPFECLTGHEEAIDATTKEAILHVEDEILKIRYDD